MEALNYAFADIKWLLLLALLPILYWTYRRNTNKRHVALQVSRLQAMGGVKTWVVYARNWLQGLRWLILAILILAMARPQRRWFEDKIEAESIDIVLAMDISPSMLTKDFNPDRLTVAKNMASDFVNKRKDDRIGLVAFSGGAFTHCPLTNEHWLTKGFIQNLQVGRIKDGTAIGMGLATAVNRLKDAQSVSKVVILLTDGENNAGQIGPIRAAEIAKSLGIKVYTIGLGTEGTVLSPLREGPLGTYIFAKRNMFFDTQLLKDVANITNGKFYRAYNLQDLQEIYAEIDTLEKTKTSKVEVHQTQELFFYLLNLAFCLLLLEMVLRWGPLRVITV
jgi:Ca-activated chloride channel homolog